MKIVREYQPKYVAVRSLFVNVSVRILKDAQPTLSYGSDALLRAALASKVFPIAEQSGELFVLNGLAQPKYNDDFYSVKIVLISINSPKSKIASVKIVSYKVMILVDSAYRDRFAKIGNGHNDAVFAYDSLEKYNVSASSGVHKSREAK